MSSASIKEGLEGIASEVLADVQKEAEKLILKAEKEAKEILRAAKEESDKIYAKAMSEAESKVSSERRKLDSKAEVEIRNQILGMKDALMQSAFEKAQMRLTEIIKLDAYNQILMTLIEEAVKKIGSKSLIIQVNSKDQIWLRKYGIDLLSERLQVDLKLAEVTIPSIGGCRVQTVDGKLAFDNTFENRLLQLQPTLRPELAKILFQKEGSINVS